MKFREQPYSEETERVAAELRRDIVSGNRPPGTTLSERQIGDQYQAGRAAVRRAVHCLLDENLAVPGAPRSAARVAKVSYQDIIDLFMVAQETATLSSYLACQRRTPEDLRRLGRILERLETCIEQEKYPEVLGHGLEFGDAVTEMACNPVLLDLDKMLRTRLRAYLEVLAQPITSAEAYRAIYEAFVDRNAPGAAALVGRFFDISVGWLIEQAQQGDSRVLPIAGVATSAARDSEDKPSGRR
ncbi:GntR family transcriptional regulator [Arthrobacter sp. NPDC090010]|uniref:GntR family transcriptional regulator n=1 Tax=Arthrobacter sp. NPDC090010 TaxID=3363942 RepID=UPI003820F80D